MTTDMQAHSLVVKSNPSDDTSTDGIILFIDGKEFLASELRLDATAGSLIHATVTFQVYSLDLEVAAGTTINDIEKTETSDRKIQLKASKEPTQQNINYKSGEEITAINMLRSVDVKPVISKLQLTSDTDTTVSNSINSISIHAKAGEPHVTAKIECNPFKPVLGSKSGPPAKVDLDKLVASDPEVVEHIMCVITGKTKE